MLLRAQIKQMSKEQLKGQWNKKALFTFVYLFISVNISIIVGMLFNIDGKIIPLSIYNGAAVQYEANAVMSSVSAFLASLTAMPLMFGYTESFMQTRIGQNPEISILFSKYSSFGKIAVYSIAYGILNIVSSAVSEFLGGMFLVGGIVSLVFAVLVIWLRIRLSMTKYILIENPYTNVITALRQSFFLTEGHVLQILVLYLSFIGWLLLGAFTFCIGILWVCPYVEMTLVNFYYDLKYSKNEN